MALNLWKLAGKSTSINPLVNSSSMVLGIGEFSLSFNAYSASSGKIRLGGDNGLLKVNGLAPLDIQLTPQRTKYTVSIVNTASQNLYVLDTLRVNDFIIDSIELVQKPLAKLTVNGVDGFNSGKWGGSQYRTFIDDETVTILPNGSYTEIFYELIPVIGQTYTFSCEKLQVDGEVKIRTIDNAYNTIQTVYSEINNSVSITVPSNASRLRVFIGSGSKTGTFTFKRPMLNLGTTPAPYSRKIGDRMVMPNAKKNLFDGILESGDIDGTTGLTKFGIKVRSVNFQSVSGNKIYSLSRSTPIDYFYIMEYDLNKNFIKFTKSGFNDSSLSITTSTNTKYVKIVDNANDLTSKIQLEEGTSATTYTPYDVQLNKKPRRGIAKKNLILSDIKDWVLLWSNTTTSVISDYRRITLNTTNQSTSAVQGITNISIVSGKTYTLSYTARANRVGVIPSYTYLMRGGLNNTNKQFSAFTTIPPLGTEWARYSMTMTSDNTAFDASILFGLSSNNVNGDWIDVKEVQLEESASPTQYEPYTLVTPKARTGLAFNKSGNIAIPYTFTRKGALEIDFTPLSVDYNFNTIFDNSVDGNTFEMWIYASGQLAVRGNASTTRNTDNDRLIANTRYLVRWEWDADLGAQNLYVNNKLYSSAFDWATPGNTFYLNGGNIGNSSGNNTFYSLKIWDGNGVLTNSYDFTNASNIVGSTVLQNARNLIPDFNDARWSLHANTQVLGKDVLRLNATVPGQWSYIELSVMPNKTYLFSLNNLLGRGRVRYGSYTGTGLTGSNLQTFVVPDGVYSIFITFDNNTFIGSTDFIKPQLYALNGTEGTLNGNPTRLNKSSRRTIYAKR